MVSSSGACGRTSSTAGRLFVQDGEFVTTSSTKDWVEKPKPVVQEATDVIVKITKTTICGSDLHILKGDVPSVTEGRALGHEGVGVVEDVGNVVRSFRINRLSF
ncbi:alcohol dehydrogenase catalytic domain-containing protein [Rhizobium leguminosarum]|nr:alcohol dehydrogenase catalytic domain-containing protein [Rhizobium ruizarguesonis]TCA15698.1 hypothetical protein E0H70_35515 [Rhizobium leguminosarum bv. viciae]